MEPRRRTVFGLTWLSYASYYFTRKGFAVAKGDIQTELGLTTRQLGDIDTVFQGAYCAGQFVWGWAADRVGSRRILGFGMLATAACAMEFGSSSAFAGMLVLWALNGLAQSTGWPANIKAIGAAIPAERRGSLMGWWSTCYQVGSLAANPLAAAFLAWMTWRGAFFGPAVIVAAVGVIILLFLPESPAAATPAAAVAVTAAERRRVMRTPLVWALGASYFFLKLTRYVLLSWLPYYMGKAATGLHYDASLAANAPLAFEAGGFAGAIIVGTASQRRLGGRRLGISIACLIGLAAALPLYAWAAPLGLAANFASLALVGFFLFGPDTLLSGAAAQDLGGAAAAATAAGIINGLGSLGPIAQGRLTAWLSEGYGWGVLFGSLGGGAAASAAILFPFWLRSRR